MPCFPRAGRIAAALTIAGLGVAGATSAVPMSAPPAKSAGYTSVAPFAVSAGRAAATAAPAASAAAIDSLTAIARRQYAAEVHGGVAVATARRIARDPALLRTLESGNAAATRAYVARQFPAVWYHWHVSRMRIRRGSSIVVETGVPFVVAPTQVTLRSPGGRALGTLDVSVQDEIGFVRLMHRNYPVDVVVRGRGAGQVRTSLPAATSAALPSSGPVTLAGRRYVVRSFPETAWNGEPVTAWILAKA